jgi:protein gp37
MSDRTAIEWTDATWNPVTGCTKVSAGCDHCYAERFSERFRGVPGHPFENGFDLTLRPERLGQPFRWRGPRHIFVNSMSDLFHKDIPRSFVDRVFETMEHADWHIYQVLTKRSSLMRDYVNRRYSGTSAPPHIWLGVSIENRGALARLRHLQQTHASLRFVSFEPLIGPIGQLDLSGVHWAIVGGESGPGYRPLDPAWVREIRDQCLEADMAFFFKQWGGRTPKAGGSEFEGRVWMNYPSTTAIRLALSHPMQGEQRGASEQSWAVG